MHVMMTKEQFDELKKKAGKGKESKGSKDGEAEDSKDKDSQGGEGAKLKLKEEDDAHGTIETDDFVLSYFYNPSEGRLFLGPVTKRKTLAAYCAGDQIVGTYVMDKLSQMPSPKANGKEKKEGDSQEGEKKDQEQHQGQNQPSQ